MAHYMNENSPHGKYTRIPPELSPIMVQITADQSPLHIQS